MWFINNWYSHTIDVKTAFLYAVLEKEIKMNIPEGMAELFEDYCVYKDF